MIMKNYEICKQGFGNQITKAYTLFNTVINFLLNVILDTPENTKKFNGMRDVKIP